MEGRHLDFFSYLQSYDSSHNFDSTVKIFMQKSLYFLLSFNSVNMALDSLFPTCDSKGKVNNQECCEDNCKIENKARAALRKQKAPYGHYFSIDNSQGKLLLLLFHHKK